MRRTLPLLLLLLAAAAVLAPPATAAPYDYVLQDCIDRNGSPSCSTTDPGLRADDVAVSPDGRSVYVVGYTFITDRARVPLGKLAVYARSDDGSLRLSSCFTAEGGGGCADAAIPALTSADSVAVSPDGRSVYVGAIGGYPPAHSGAVLVFSRATDGGLTFRSCIGNGTADGCANGKAALGMGEPDDIAVSPDGEHVVVGSGAYGDGSIVDFRRDADGDLRWAGCLSTSTPSCREAPEVYGVRGLAFSADGRDLYAATNDQAGSAGLRATVVHLVRDDTGSLEFADCVGSGPPRCRTTSSHIFYALGIAVSPSDGEVFVAAPSSPAVTRFLRGPSGRLSEFGCVSSERLSGCASTGTRPFGIGAVAVSPDGSGLYGLNGDGKLYTFTVNAAEPGLTPIRCQAPVPERYSGAFACEGLSSTGGSLAFSPDGSTLYGASIAGYAHSLAIWRREDIRPETTVSPGAGMPVRPPGMGGIGMLRGRMQFTLDRAATVTITLSRVLRGRLVRGRCVTPTKANARRRACTRAKKAGKLVRNGVAGTNTVSLPKSLPEGRYRATLIAVAGEQRSEQKATSFKIG
jgi:DNA-binding beta-propeller fold protein YncE